MRFLTFTLLVTLQVSRGEDIDVISSRETIPAPIVVSASQNWEGIDGPWSTFAFQVGTPAQTVRLFISTAAYVTSVVLPQGCMETDPKDCADQRGGQFLINSSSTWMKNTATLSTNIYPLTMGTSLGYTGTAAFGFDDITIGWKGAGGPMLKNQSIGGIATKDTYLGLFGLTPRSINFTSFNEPLPGIIQSLRSSSKIPSTSWGYTAGNQYRLNRVLGSLTLGGYDQSRFLTNNVIWSFDNEDVRDLTVQIRAITASTASRSLLTDKPLLPNPIPAFLDSSLPYIWLPIEACIAFEQAFGLSWDPTTQLYPISDSQHASLVSQNPNITFVLGNGTAGADVNITFPYAAFDLKIQPPLVTNTTRYFPLKRASNSTQYTLGRTFFQEAYVWADYDRSMFSVSQCKWESNPKPEIVPILASSISATGTTNSTNNPQHSVPIGAIIGGAVGGFVVLAAIAVFLFFFCVIKPRRRRRQAEADAATAAAMVRVEEKAELAGQEESSQDLSLLKPALKPELHSPHQSFVPQKAEWNYNEADSRPIEIHEMPGEEAAHEVTGSGGQHEMQGSAGATERSNLGT